MRHRWDIVHAVDVWIEHRIGAVFGDLLYATMQVADNAFRAEDFFAIQLQNDAQHAVSGRMLRAHIDYELVGIEKGLLALLQFQRRATIRHLPLSIPKLICTHSLSC